MGLRSILQKLITTMRNTNQELQPIRHIGGELAAGKSALVQQTPSV